ncbi:E3 ubiquitin-protein ligase TRAIP-like isoform X1 [Vespa velutina]|uniref:E3 ubiquitin-protein ligase TRAIP-like isoform X1 n=2 Tax=Vespa velutina TaxID=202808 RepID=UPI001FB2A212|nr:E3 ubiquitin-protein ligase TRAIP-like isoform X1 [Vespa velutina]
MNSYRSTLFTSDLLMPSDDVFYTPCGHIFHFTCLIQWLERSKSCPQCREKTNQNKIHRIYFNFSNNDTIVEDTSFLQDKVDKLTFQILLKDKDIKHYTEKNENLEKQNTGLRSEVKKAESEVREKETAIHALKEQIKYFRQQCTEVDIINQEVIRLRKRVEDLKNIQLLMDAPAEEVDDMVSKTNDSSTLITYISIMKRYIREMAKCVTKRREMRAKLQSIQQELTKVSMERNYLLEEQEKRKKLEEELITCENEKMVLQNKLQDIENNGYIKTHVSNIMKTKESYSNSIKISKEEVKHTDQMGVKNDTKSSLKRKTNFIMEDIKINSPNIPVQSKGILALKEQYTARQATRSTFSILTKKPRLSQNSVESVKNGSITYDGFGGHSKYDKFPSPIQSAKLKRTKECLSKPRKPKLDTGDNKKLSDLIIDIS